MTITKRKQIKKFSAVREDAGGGLMKFLHIGDLHFGKMLHNVPLIEEDQPFWVDQLIRTIDNYQPDAIVIAGDIYDRKVPSPEAMILFDHMLTELSKRDIYVFVIPGNHDSAVRLSHVNELLTSHKIYIAGELKKDLDHVTIHSRDISVTFWLMPYMFPKAVSDKKVLDHKDITTYDEAARSLIKAQNIVNDECNVLIAHQNVLANGVAPEHSDSETIIGGIGEIEVSAFDDFDYVALGHIHNSQKIGRETVRYSGCPLYYDFSEINRWKGLTLVTINSKDDISVEMIDIPHKHTLLQISGTFEELLKKGESLEGKERYYIQCILQDKHVPPRALEQLRETYGKCLINVRRELPGITGERESITHDNKVTALSFEEQFSLFYQEQENELMDSIQELVVHKILEQQVPLGGDFVNDPKAVSDEDSEELFRFLSKLVMEENE